MRRIFRSTAALVLLVAASGCGRKAPMAPHVATVTSEAAASSLPCDGGVCSHDASADASGSDGRRECTSDDDCAVLATAADCDGPTEYRATTVAERSYAVGHRHGVRGRDGGTCDMIRRDDTKVALCEQHACQLHDTAEAMSWAASVVPRIADLQPARSIEVTDAPWFKKGERVVLYVPSDWRGHEPEGDCHAIRFESAADGLYADLDLSSDRPAGRFGCFARVVLAGTANELGPACNYPDGSGSERMDFTSIGGGEALSSADDRGLTYGGSVVHATAACRWLGVERPGCVPEQCRSCQIVLQTESIGPAGASKGQIHDQTVVLPDAGCSACLPDRNEVLASRITAILRGLSFSSITPSPFAFQAFRKKGDCLAAVRELQRLRAAPRRP